MNKKILAITLTLLSTSVFSQYKVHVLEEGDTLSALLREQNYNPLYGEKEWVQKTLEMNHLTEMQARKIKKGYPIILPSKKSFIIDNVSTKKSAVLRSGLFGNQISSHQDLYFNVQYFQNQTKLNGATAAEKQNYSLGLSLDGRNNYNFIGANVNFGAQIAVETNSSSDISGSQNINTQFEPTYNIGGYASFEYGNMPVEFRTHLKVEEKSHLYEESTDSYEIRRDQNLWAGIGIHKSFEVSYLNYKFDTNIQELISQSAQGSLENYRATKTQISLAVNLTKDYYFGIFSKNINYRSSSIVADNILGLTLSYNIK